MEQVEEYSATHSETFEDLLDWPAVRFEAAWESYKRREALEKLEADHRSLVAAHYANSNMDEKSLKAAIKHLQDGYAQSRAKILETTAEERDKDGEQFVSHQWW